MAPVAVPSWRDVDVDAVCASVRAVAFDLDNTLARSRKPMKPDMAARFSALTRMLPVAVVTGGRYGLVVSQVLDMLGADAVRTNLHLMPTSGTRYYRWGGDRWDLAYSHDIDERSKRAIVASLERRARELGLWEERAWGPRIDDRGSQITFSALGQTLAGQETTTRRVALDVMFVLDRSQSMEGSRWRTAAAALNTAMNS